MVERRELRQVLALLLAFALALLAIGPASANARSEQLIGTNGAASYGHAGPNR